jgi:hypothetical protein
VVDALACGDGVEQRQQGAEANQSADQRQFKQEMF